MPDVSFDSLAVVLGVAFVVPLALGLLPRLRVPAVVFEIVFGIVVGPQVLGWAKVDEPVQILSVVGLAFLLFLGAFVAGAIVSVVDRDAVRTHPQFRVKLEAIGYGFLIPVFFVTSGLRFDLDALLDKPSTLLRVPVFLVALLVVRGLPALVYRPLVGTRGSIVAGLLQATSLPFIVAATQIGIVLGLVTAATAAAFVAAGLLSALVFPTVALALLRGSEVSTCTETTNHYGQAPAEVAG